ncbi:hypothetical protein OSB04_014360, partial [Centaurea solstitialis]
MRESDDQVSSAPISPRPPPAAHFPPQVLSSPSSQLNSPSLPRSPLSQTTTKTKTGGHKIVLPHALPAISAPVSQFNSPSMSRSPFLGTPDRPMTVPPSGARNPLVLHLTKLDPHDAWLPITESRNGNAFYAAFHTLCSGIGIQALVLPVAFTFLGWVWGIISLMLVFIWQLYTLYLLVNLHESIETGMRYSRYMQLANAAFGERLGNSLAKFPILYLSGGTCVALIIIGGSTAKIFFQIVCDDSSCKAERLTSTEWYLVFTCGAVLLSQLPNMNSIAGISLVGAITAIGYCTTIWVVSVVEGRPSNVSYDLVKSRSNAAWLFNIFNALGIIAFAFRGHNLILEIQATMPSSEKHPSRIPMWRGVKASYALIAICVFPLAIGGYWAYGQQIPTSGMLNALLMFHGKDLAKSVQGLVCLLVIINSLTSFQIYAMPTFDEMESGYVIKFKKPCPWWLRVVMRSFFGFANFLFAVAFPFLGSVAGLVGGIALPVTLAYPCFMWLKIKKPQVYSLKWWLNWVLGVFGMLLSVVVIVGGFYSIIDTGRQQKRNPISKNKAKVSNMRESDHQVSSAPISPSPRPPSAAYFPPQVLSSPASQLNLPSLPRSPLSQTTTKTKTGGHKIALPHALPAISAPVSHFNSPSMSRSPFLGTPDRPMTVPPSGARTPLGFIMSMNLTPKFLTPLGSPLRKVLHLTKLDPHDAWLPITESRNGNAFYAAFHTLCSGIGIQALVLPVAFTFLGWVWGIISLILVFIWQLYTLYLLVNLHESIETGMRYSRYMQLANAAFGERLGNSLAKFPILYLSGGTCVALIIIGGSTAKIFFQIVCDDSFCKAERLTSTEWYLVFTCGAVLLSQLPNMNSIAGISLVGAITAIGYCTTIWVVSVVEGRSSNVSYDLVKSRSDVACIFNIFNAFGIIAFAFRGHNLILEIQATMPSSGIHPSRIPMWRGVKASYALIAICVFPLAIGGYWAYGQQIPTSGMLNALFMFHGKDLAKSVQGLACLLVIINSLTSFQIYAMPTFDEMESGYVIKFKKPCPWWLRVVMRSFFGFANFFFAVAFPFLGSVAGLVGGIALPVTLAYPCFMWLKIKKPQVYSLKWWLNWVLGVFGMGLSVVVIVGALYTIIDTGVQV